MRRVSLGCWPVVVLLLACKSGGETAPQRPAPAETEARAQAEAEAPAPTPPPARMACQEDADCALTRVPEGDCCPRLCAPRAVPAAEARALEEAVVRCEREGHPCPLPSCRAAMAFEVGCAAGKCVPRRVDDR